MAFGARLVASWVGQAEKRLLKLVVLVGEEEPAAASAGSILVRPCFSRHLGPPVGDFDQKPLVDLTESDSATLQPQRLTRTSPVPRPVRAKERGTSSGSAPGFL